MKKHFEEKHTVTKKLCTQFVYLTMYKSPMVIGILALCALLFVVGVFLVSIGSYGGITFEAFFLPIVMLPILYFTLKRQANITYKKFLEKGAGHEPEQIITVDEYISAYNPCTDSSREIEFSQIKHIYENKDIFVLITEAKLGIIITKCGFTSGDSEDFKNYLYENAKNAKVHK
ncbi:MAG: YcxB family protein [Oscillospiraceae bacterium]